LIQNLNEDFDIWGPLFVRWELGVLTELGYGLDLTECAATGSTEDLIYVSPKSGRAVSKNAGAVYHDKMLRLPGFLRRMDCAVDDTASIFSQVCDGLTLSGFFLNKSLLPHYREEALPARERFLNALHLKFSP